MTHTIPLRLIADEWGTSVEALISELGPDRLLIDDLEIRHISVEDARELLAARKAREARQRQADEQHREHLDAMLAPTLARVQAIQAQQHAARADGQIDSDTPALAAMRMNDTDTRLEQKGRLFEELLNAGNRGDYGTMVRLSPQSQEV
jgi:hypothetical protein